MGIEREARCALLYSVAWVLALFTQVLDTCTMQIISCYTWHPPHHPSQVHACSRPTAPPPLVQCIAAAVAICGLSVAEGVVLRPSS